MVRKRAVKSEKKKDKALQTDVYNTKGKVVGKISLSHEIFQAKENPRLLAQAVRVYLANQRLGTHSTKTRGQVTGSTRKIYRQKGTGRARHGDIKAPIFIGGGIAFGPKPRDYRLLLSKRMRKLAFFSALSDKFQQGKLKVINGLEDIPAKTKEMVEVLSRLQLINGKKEKNNQILLILGSQLRNVFLAGRNLSYLTTSEVNLLNTYLVLTHKNLLFTKDAVNRLTDIFLKRSSDVHTITPQIEINQNEQVKPVRKKRAKAVKSKVTTARKKKTEMKTSQSRRKKVKE